MNKDKEWVKKTINHQETGAIPYYFGFTPPVLRKVEEHYGGPIGDILNFPIRMNVCNTIKPLYADPLVSGETAKDEFGVLWTTSKIDRGAPIVPCLTDADLSGYAFPDFKASYRFENLGDWCKKNREHYIFLWVGDLWERAVFMRGMENILMDLVLNPKFVDELLRSLTDYIMGTMEILFDKFEFDGIGVSDDYGTENSMLMSPEHWRKFIMPRLTEIYKFAKSHDKTVLHHSDGYIYPIIRDMIDIGCDVLHPVQPESMDIFKLKREFGKDITFFGGMRTQDLLVWGTVIEIRDEVRKLKQQMGKGGGYIISNGIVIQIDVPLDNVIAMIDESLKGGR